MVVYADTVFFLNFLFDAEILILVCAIQSEKIYPKRILCSAFIGGIQGILSFVPFFRYFCVPPIGVVLPLVMVWIVFRPKKGLKLISFWITFIVTSFLLSGAIVFCGIKTPWSLIMPLPIYLLVRPVKKYAARKKIKTRLVYQGKEYSEFGFYDSGNTIRYCGNPVIIGGYEIFEGLFGKDFSVSNIQLFVNSEDIRAVPYKSLGKNGMLIGIMLDEVIVNEKKYSNVVLGYSSDNFSEKLILNGSMID